MRKRDIAILNDLQRFRCLTRDDIMELHFNNLKQPVTCCNTVLKRLRRDGLVDVNVNHQPYLYFPSPAPIKKDSTKIPHFLRIVEFYKSLGKYSEPKTFIVEPKYGKGFMEPDAFMIWKKAPFFVEIQRSIYSEKVMNEKIQRYEAYYMSNEWQQEPWQPQNKKVFPAVIVITDTRYKIESPYIKFYQVPNIDLLINMFEPKQEKKTEIMTGNTPLKLKTV
ncbi:replication-relaxation family protein [Cytobacillus oceanisediminis]|uniref:replication-relaxation family protein n=1 Tax=Cytobacillus oceanisediminis TaxID=665099 RepID=UPI002040491B|nr:replication-relaxation family protein [Cytobacillus oceanisediminis]MCM3405932.1 replication-relaxation family protein [Cytobacillus oceanisediminis]